MFPVISEMMTHKTTFGAVLWEAGDRGWEWSRWAGLVDGLSMPDSILNVFKIQVIIVNKHSVTGSLIQHLLLSLLCQVLHKI